LGREIREGDMTTTIAIVNRKGGSGKTTSVLSLGGAYARAGERTLLIDMDPQADLTGALSADDPDQLPIEATAAALFTDQYVSSERLIVPTAFANLSLLPCSKLLRAANGLEPGDSRQFALRAFVRDVAHLFDRVLIDNPPDLGFLAWASLAAARFVVTPVKADAKGFRALKPVNQFIERVQFVLPHPELVQLGYVRTVFEARKNVHQIYSARIERSFPGLLMREVFPKAAQFEDADAAQQPITHFKSRCAATKAVERIAAEIDERIQRLQGAADHQRKEVA
jgi:chromosome partitioning protein